VTHENEAILFAQHSGCERSICCNIWKRNV